jgi:nucleoside-diphosphate-sugar epimerase
LRLLVTGSDSFTGQHLIPRALSQGHEVHGLKSNLKNINSLTKEIRSIEPEGVIHLAGISFVCQTNPAEFYEVNTIGSLNLLEALANLSHPPQKVLLASSANVYGNVTHSPINELEAPHPINHYGISKTAMEGLINIYQYRLPIDILRCFNYTGRGQSKDFLIPKLIHHFKNKLPSIELGNLDIKREFNDVRMVADVYLKLLLKQKSGEVYNICSGSFYSIDEIIKALEHLTNHLIEIKKNPNFIRHNELSILCGDPAKLIDAIGDLPQFTIEETLQWMLEA